MTLPIKQRETTAIEQLPEVTIERQPAFQCERQVSGKANRKLENPQSTHCRRRAKPIADIETERSCRSERGDPAESTMGTLSVRETCPRSAALATDDAGGHDEEWP
jgi:hypothetical protein